MLLTSQQNIHKIDDNYSVIDDNVGQNVVITAH